MSMLKNTVRKLFSSLGYRVIRERADVPYVRFDNFRGLAEAYEQLVNESRGHGIVAPSEIRSHLMARLMGTLPGEAYHIVESLAKTVHVSGNVCEFGVAQGETSALIATEIENTTKVLHLFDSFQGLPKPTEKDRLKDDIFSLGTMAAYEGRMASPQDMVLSRLRAVSFPLERTVIHTGFIEETIDTDRSLPTAVSFAYVDFDFYEPIKIALNFLHGVTSAGAIILVDDYDFFSTGAKTAVDEFVAAMGVYDAFVPDTRFGHFAVLTKNA